ncbi:MAG: MFS transporter [Kosmotogaceae bacterium]
MWLFPLWLFDIRAIALTNPFRLLIGKSLVGFTFGGMLAIFPVVTADFFGLKNLGLNYGLMITAWDVGRILGPFLGGLTRDIKGGYETSYLISAILGVAGALISLLVRHPEIKKAEIKKS